MSKKLMQKCVFEIISSVVIVMIGYCDCLIIEIRKSVIPIKTEKIVMTCVILTY
jgi:hypothetical protein